MSQLTLSAILKIVDQATRPLKAVQQQTEQSSEAISRLDDSIDRLNRTLSGNNTQRYNNSLRQTEQHTSAARMATKLLVGEYHDVSRVLTTIIAKSEQWSASLARGRANMRQQMKGMLIGGATAGFGAYQFLKPALDFEKQMSGVQAVLDLDKTSQQMKILTADARKWGAASSFSPTETAAAQFALGSGGFNFDQIHDSIGGTLQLAEAGKVELEQAAQIAVGTLNGFGLAAADIGRVNDVFLQATNATATSVQGLGETMKYVAPIAKAYGASIESTTAMTGLLGNANILDTQAGTSLRGIMTRLAAPPNEAADALAELNVKTTDSKGNLREMADVLAEINKKTAKMGDAKRLDIFKSIAGQEAISAFAVLVDQSAVLDKNSGKTVNKIKELTAQLEGSQGAAARAAAILKDNLAGDIENMGGAWQDLSISVANVLKNDLRGFVQQITSTIDKIKAWVDANPELVRTLASIAIKLLMFKVAMMSVKYTSSLLFGGIFSLIAGMTKLGLALWVVQVIAGKLGLGVPSRLQIMTRLTLLLSRAFIFLSRRAIPLVLMGLRALAVGLLTNPLTLAIVAIGIAALVIHRYWSPLKAFFSGFWAGLKGGFAATKLIISDFLNSIAPALEPLRPVWDWLNEAFVTFKGVLSEMLTPFQATNDQLATANSYGQTFGTWLAIVISALLAMKVALIAVSAIQGFILFLNAIRVALVGYAVATSAAAAATWALLAPFLPIIIAVGLLAVAAFLIIKNWQPIKQFFMEMWQSIKTGAADLWAGLSSAFTNIKTLIIQVGATFLDFLLAPIRQVIGSVNTLITSMNRIPGIKIPQIPQIPTLAAPAAGSTGVATAPGATKPTTPVQARPVIPMRAAASSKPQQVTQHFAAPIITVSGVTDPKAVGILVDQKLKQHQLAQAATQRRAYTDQA